MQLNWSEIDTVLLDMDGTLLDLFFDNYFWLKHVPQQYAIIHHISFKESSDIVNSLLTPVQGTLKWYCLDYWTDTLKLDIKKLKYDLSYKIALRPYSLPFLQWLNANNKQVYLITNAHPFSMQLKIDKLQIHSYFKDLISTHSYQYPKEHNHFWQQLHSDLQYNLQKSLFIDDNIPILNTALQNGITHVLNINQPDMSLPPRSTSFTMQISHFYELNIPLK